MSTNMNRRNFLKTAAASSAALAGAATFAAPGRAMSANEKMHIGLIGAGGRGQSVARVALRDPGVELVAVCDVYESRRKQGAQLAKSGCPEFVDHRKLLELPGLDAVIIATPEHHHAPQLFDALAAGKDVYLEKPMSTSIEQGAEMIKRVRATDRIVQIGMQRRSSPMVREGKKLMDDGILGEVSLVRAQFFWHIPPLDLNAKFDGEFDWKRFLGSAPARPVEPIRALQWRYFWDYAGGIVCDQGAHLIDLVQYYMGQGTPRSAVMQGGAYQLNYETPDTFCAAMEYPKFTCSWMVTYTNCYQDGWEIIFQGNKGTMIVNDAGYRAYKEPWREVANREPFLQSQGGIPTDPHVANWLECVRSRQQPNAPVEIGHTAVAGPHLCNAAFRNKSVAKLDEACTKVTL